MGIPDYQSIMLPLLEFAGDGREHTVHFSKEAREYAASIDSKIVLIDGERLAELMIDYGVGVSRVTSYEIKKIDQDYFTEA